MSTTLVAASRRETKPSALTRILRARVHEKLEGLAHGELVLHDALGVTRFGRAVAAHEAVDVHVLNADAFYRAAALEGSVGLCDAYGDGVWDTHDLVGLVRLFVRNTALLDGIEGSALASVAGFGLRAWHAARRNTREGSRKNIAEHYDLGNDLFETFLDPTMMYSSGIYAKDEDTLEVAQQRKLARICEKLDLSPADHLLEIGTGWGGLAIFAASRYGCRVTTATISRAQHELATERIREAGLSERITVVLADYRDLEGRYDKLVSVEMVEAVGAAYLDTYFAQISRLLTDEGLALVQAITIEDHRYEQALASVDFIKRFIFPGSFIPSTSVLLASMARVTDLTLASLEEIGASYARTLADWRTRFSREERALRALGYDERFSRLFTLYFAYCEGGFREQRLGTVQLLFRKPGARRAPYLPGLL